MMILIAACEAIKAAKPDMICLDVGSKDNWSDVFVLDTIMMELGGPEYYVKFFKGEVDVANDPIFKESLEKFAASAAVLQHEGSLQPDLGPGGQRSRLWTGSHDDHGDVGYWRLHQRLQLAARRRLRRGELSRPSPSASCSSTPIPMAAPLALPIRKSARTG